MQDLQDNDILIFENSTIHFEAIKCGLIVLKIVDQKKNINIYHTHIHTHTHIMTRFLFYK